MELHEYAVSSMDRPEYELDAVVAFGSSVSKLCVAGSFDIDVVLSVSQPGSLVDVELGHEGACQVLALVKGGVACRSAFEVTELVTKTRVPVLKLRHVQTNTEVNTCANLHHADC